MKDIKYNVERFYKTLTTDEFYERFSNFEVVQGYCKECPRYDTNYSCSPLDIDIKEFITSYDYIDIIVTQVQYDEIVYNADYSKDELNDVINKTFFKERKKVVDKLLDSEKKYTKAESLTGPCNHCTPKCKEVYSECKHPEIRRYSLASLGIDSKKILKDLFDIDLILINGKLPKYMNNISSILYTK